MRRSRLVCSASIGILVIVAFTDAVATAQARLHGPPARAGAAEIVARLAVPAVLAVPADPTSTSNDIQAKIENPGATPKRDEPRWWVWMLVGGGLVLVGGTLWIIVLGRRWNPVSLEDPVPGGRVSVVLKTIPLRSAGGKTPPISPVAADSRGTVHLLPPPGLAAWLVVYRDGIPCETLVLQTTGVTTIGRDGSTSICLADAAVSKRHATIMAVGGRFVLEDATHPRPQNPTKVDGNPLEGPIELRDNMRLQIGATLLRFRCTA